MSSRCPVHQVKIKICSPRTTIFWRSRYTSPRTTIFWRTRLDKSYVQLCKVLQHHRLPQDLSGPDQGSMVVECCTTCSIYDSPQYSGSLPGHTPQGYGHSEPNNYHSTLVLKRRFLRGLLPATCLYSVPGPAGHTVPPYIQYLDPPDTYLHPLLYIYDSPHS